MASSLDELLTEIERLRTSSAAVLPQHRSAGDDAAIEQLSRRAVSDAAEQIAWLHLQLARVLSVLSALRREQDRGAESRLLGHLMLQSCNASYEMIHYPIESSEGGDSDSSAENSSTASDDESDFSDGER